MTKSIKSLEIKVKKNDKFLYVYSAHSRYPYSHWFQFPFTLLNWKPLRMLLCKPDNLELLYEIFSKKAIFDVQVEYTDET